MGSIAEIVSNYEYKSLRLVVKHVRTSDPDGFIAKQLDNLMLAPAIRLTYRQLLEGHYCGYVTTFSEVKDAENVLDVHGGITYETKNADGSFTYGFDCAHSYDTLEYWTLERVQNETEDLARQILKLTRPDIYLPPRKD